MSKLNFFTMAAKINRYAGGIDHFEFDSNDMKTLRQYLRCAGNIDDAINWCLQAGYYLGHKDAINGTYARGKSIKNLSKMDALLSRNQLELPVKKTVKKKIDNYWLAYTESEKTFDYITGNIELTSEQKLELSKLLNKCYKIKSSQIIKFCAFVEQNVYRLKEGIHAKNIWEIWMEERK